jgi:cation diffusion facilitator CzcD-associated flavoprotein CzcO
MLLYRAYIFLTRDLRHNNWRDANSKGAVERRDLLTRHMKYVIKSQGREDLIPKLIPDFPVGCKRIGQSDEYIQALCSSKCTVDRSPIQKIQGRTISTADGVDTEVDALILATGFDVTGFLGDLQVTGKDGLSLNELWENNTAKTYKTVSIHGFPNFYIMLGPGSGLGHNSVVAIVER